MSFHALIGVAARPFARSFRRWLFRLGGLGFFPLGLLDASIIPVQGSMDLLTVVLSARRPDLWLYYALMATAGSVIGGLAMYRIARKGGKETLSRRVSAAKLDKVYATFQKWGFGSIAIPALLPPPVPMVPFVLAAGALQYSIGKFLAALTLGRTIRFVLLALVGAHYGRGAMRFISNQSHPGLIETIAVAATLAVLLFLALKAKWRTREPARPS
jgi:membrane protein YqaA with SNARE-associated domain